MNHARALIAAAAAAAGLALAGCSTSGAAAGGEDLSNRQIRIATTTNFITDTVSQIAGERAEVTGLMGPGVDPHLYKASAGDVGTLRDADVIFYGGLDLEGRMADLFVELASDRRTVPVAAAVPERMLLEPPEFAGKFDPHVWFDPELWRFAMGSVAETLAEVDPEHAADYEARLTALHEAVDEAEAACRVAFEEIPEPRRVLVTSHDAFNYFGRAFGFDVVAIQGISTATEASTADIKRVADLLVERDVPTVFVESSLPRQTIEAVVAAAAQQDHAVQIGGELFSDAAGEAGTPEGTYPGMLKANCETIAEGLS